MDASAFGLKLRRPTLAEPIEPLPSAMLCLTAEFGKGSVGAESTRELTKKLF